ncbi:MAG: hypothetical protein HDP34_03385 [Clostridia bacterium]|nr:hypothetical protein [Clostridia bacterium]
MKVSDFYGKKVVSTAGKRGYVVSVNASAEKVECLICADSDENEFMVDVNNVVRIGDTKIIYDDRETAMRQAKPVRLGSLCFDESGNYLGTLCDYLFNNRGLQKAKIGKKNYPAERVISGDVIIVKDIKTVKSDVLKDGKILIKKGTPVTEEVLKTAESEGEYVQLTMKSI